MQPKRSYVDATGLWRWSDSDEIPFDDQLRAWGVSGVWLERHQNQRTIDNNRRNGLYIGLLKGDSYGY